MNAARQQRHWPAWIDDILAYGPIAELETEWQVAVADALTRVLDERNGTRQLPACPDCGSLLTLHCTIAGCGLPKMPLRWRAGAWLRRQRAKRMPRA